MSSPPQEHRATEVVALFDGEIVATFHLTHGNGRRTGRSRQLIVGSTAGVDVIVAEGTLTAPRVLVEVDEVGTKVWRLLDAPLGPPSRLGADELVTIALGATELHVREVSLSNEAAGSNPVDAAPLRNAGWAALAHALLLLMALSVPPDARSLALDPDGALLRAVRYTVHPTTAQPAQGRPFAAKTLWSAMANPRALGAEGAAGRPSAPPRPTRGLVARTTSQIARPALPYSTSPRTLSDEQLLHSGVLGILRASQPLRTAGLFDRGSAIGEDAQNVLGQLVGRTVDEANGDLGLGLVGHGPSGGGESPSTIGTGRLPTIGRFGDPDGKDHSGIPRAVALRERRPRAIDVQPERVMVERGTLDRELIRRVIRRHVNEVRYCYERELVRASGLSGRVVMQFTIDGQGKVVAAAVRESSLGSRAVEQCIQAATLRWDFPAATNGGATVVSYPFMLKAAEGE